MKETPKIEHVFVNDINVVVIFKNNEVRVFDKYEFECDLHTKQVVKDGIWEKIEYDTFNIKWPKYKVSGHGYCIGSDTAYEISRPLSYIYMVLPELRKKKGYTQKKLSAKLRISQKDLSAIENGKLARLDIIQKAFSVLL